MIDLRTGVPGSGKTLSAIEHLANMIARWEKHPEEARSVFVHNVKDLTLPHALLPLKSVMVGKLKMDVPDWELVPDGSYILIDECQSVFPPRASGSLMPDHVAFLNTHRHHGFDITLITQHPRLIDTSARALVGKHQHFRRLFGRQVAVCYEWDSCSDTLGGIANAVMSKFSFPKKAFTWYKSAEVHTKQTFRLPKWIFIPVIGVVLGAVAVPFAYSRITSLGSADKLRTSVELTSQGKDAKGPIKPAVGVPSASGAIVTATAAVVPVAPAEEPEEEPFGCISTATKCGCYSLVKSMKRMDFTQEQCRAHLAGLSGPLDKNPITPDAPQQTAMQTNADGEMFASMKQWKKDSY